MSKVKIALALGGVILIATATVPGTRLVMGGEGEGRKPPDLSTLPTPPYTGCGYFDDEGHAVADPTCAKSNPVRFESSPPPFGFRNE